MSVNHLKDKQSQRIPLIVAFGKQAVSGTATHSKVSGASPSHQITAFNALGEGEWNACKGAWYQGEEIPPADYHFHLGALATGMTSGPQQVDSFFDKDVPHSRTAAIGYKVPVGFGNPDIAANPPNKFKGIFETKKSWNFNDKGNLSDFSYSPNPARCILETILSCARLPNLPSVYANTVDYWLSRIDFGNLKDFRDFHAQTETVDYRTIEDFEGFGLTAKYYSGTLFNTLVSQFVHPNFDITYAEQPPAAGLNGDFSASFEGYIFFPFTETFTIYITHNDGSRLWLNGVQKINVWNDNGVGPVGTNSATFNATAHQSVDILMHWNDKGGGNYKVEWESASQARQVIPSKYLYPKADQQELYQSHVFFEQPSSVGAGIREILRISNSIWANVNGKLRFYCLDQLTSSFALDNSTIDSFEFRRRDILRVDPITELEAEFKDLDSQYLQPPPVPVSHKLDVFTRQTGENVKIENLYTTTRWRALKNLKTRAALDYGNDLLADVRTPMALSYPITAGDLITVTHRKIGASPRTYLVKSAPEPGVAESNDTQGAETEMRKLVLQEWTNETPSDDEVIGDGLEG